MEDYHRKARLVAGGHMTDARIMCDCTIGFGTFAALAVILNTTYKHLQFGKGEDNELSFNPVELHFVII
jgi:hypothetical protein